jgi:hypothetical protein
VGKLRVIVKRARSWLECSKRDSSRRFLVLVELAMTETPRCGQSHIALTALGFAQLNTWNELACEAHTRVKSCHAPRGKLKMAG